MSSSKDKHLSAVEKNVKSQTESTGQQENSSGEAETSPRQADVKATSSSGGCRKKIPKKAMETSSKISPSLSDKSSPAAVHSHKISPTSGASSKGAIPKNVAMKTSPKISPSLLDKASPTAAHTQKISPASKVRSKGAIPKNAVKLSSRISPSTSDKLSPTTVDPHKSSPGIESLTKEAIPKKGKYATSFSEAVTSGTPSRRKDRASRPLGVKEYLNPIAREALEFLKRQTNALHALLRDGLDDNEFQAAKSSILEGLLTKEDGETKCSDVDVNPASKIEKIPSSKCITDKTNKTPQNTSPPPSPIKWCTRLDSGRYVLSDVVFSQDGSFDVIPPKSFSFGKSDETLQNSGKGLTSPQKYLQSPPQSSPEHCLETPQNYPENPQHQYPENPQHQYPENPQHQYPENPQHQYPENPQQQYPETYHSSYSPPSYTSYQGDSPQNQPQNSPESSPQGTPSTCAGRTVRSSRHRIIRYNSILQDVPSTPSVCSSDWATEETLEPSPQFSPDSYNTINSEEKEYMKRIPDSTYEENENVKEIKKLMLEVLLYGLGWRKTKVIPKYFWAMVDEEKFFYMLPESTGGNPELELYTQFEDAKSSSPRESSQQAEEITFDNSCKQKGLVKCKETGDNPNSSSQKKELVKPEDSDDNQKDSSRKKGMVKPEDTGDNTKNNSEKKGQMKPGDKVIGDNPEDSSRKKELAMLESTGNPKESFQNKGMVKPENTGDNSKSNTQKKMAKGKKGKGKKK